jgi:hypothetical protein
MDETITGSAVSPMDLDEQMYLKQMCLEEAREDFREFDKLEKAL